MWFSGRSNSIDKGSIRWTKKTLKKTLLKPEMTEEARRHVSATLLSFSEYGSVIRVPVLVLFLLLWEYPNKKQHREGRAYLAYGSSLQSITGGKARQRFTASYAWSRAERGMLGSLFAGSPWLVFSILAPSKWCQAMVPVVFRVGLLTSINSQSPTDIPTGQPDLANLSTETPFTSVSGL